MNSNREPVGKCSQCGGIVAIWSGNTTPDARCDRCGAVATEWSTLPVVKTLGGLRDYHQSTSDHGTHDL